MPAEVPRTAAPAAADHPPNRCPSISSIVSPEDGNVNVTVFGMNPLSESNIVRSAVRLALVMVEK